MLQAFPTKSGTGVSIYGDYADLESLYNTIHEIAGTLSEYDKRQKGRNLLLMNFAYEVRKAKSGQRISEKLVFSGQSEPVIYNGFQLVWTDILIFITALRQCAGFIQTDKRTQADLYALEYVIEKAIYEYDSDGAATIKNFIGAGIDTTNENTFLIYQALHIEFVTQRKGKARFRLIPKLLTNYFNTWAPEYKMLMDDLRKSAEKQGCEIYDLEFAEFPEIKW